MGKDLKGKEIGNKLFQRQDGKYVARFVNRFGKRVTLYNNNLKQLKIDLADAEFADRSQMNIVEEGITLDEFYEKWIDIHKHGIIRESTRRHYVHIYSKHISPVLGKYRMTDITQLQIKGLIKDLSKQGLKYETQNKTRILLQDIFNKVMIDNFVIKNPAKGIAVKRDEKYERKVLTVEEQKLFFDCCKGTFYDNLFTVAICTGLRIGELAALRECDIDFEKKKIHVTRTLLYHKLEGDEKKTFHFMPPKTKTSTRSIPMNKLCESALRKQIMQKSVIAVKKPKELENKKDKKIRSLTLLPKEKDGVIRGAEFHDLLFTTQYNTPINSQITSDAMKRLIDEINLIRDDLEEIEYFSMHSLRHSFATRCFEAGIDPKTVQAYLGHATLQMTMDLYTHVTDDHKMNEMDKLEQKLSETFIDGM